MDRVPLSVVCWAVAFSSLCLNSCKCEAEDRAPETKPAPAPAPVLPAGVNADLLSKLEKAAQGCQVAPGQSRIDCNGGDKNALVIDFNQGKVNRVEALPTFIHALGQGSEKLKALSASVLYASFRNNLGADVKAGAVDAALTKKFIDVVLALPSSSAMQAIPAATHAAMLSGEQKTLETALSDDVSIQVRTMAYRYLMVYGRLDAFSTIQELSKRPAAAVILAAIESPRNMPDWTPEEQAAICPWAESFLESSMPAVAGNAAAVLSNCNGKHLDALLSYVERSAKDGQFDFIHATALREICSEKRRQGEGAPSDAQCEKVRSLQAKAAQDERVQARVRAMSLSTLAYAQPDEKTLDLAKKLSKAKEGDVARAAAQIVTRLSPQIEAAK